MDRGESSGVPPRQGCVPGADPEIGKKGVTPKNIVFTNQKVVQPPKNAKKGHFI